MTATERRALIEAPLPTVRYIPSKSWAGVLRDPELKFANRMDRDADSADMAALLATRESAIWGKRSVNDGYAYRDGGY